MITREDFKRLHWEQMDCLNISSFAKRAVCPELFPHTANKFTKPIPRGEYSLRYFKSNARPITIKMYVILLV